MKLLNLFRRRKSVDRDYATAIQELDREFPGTQIDLGRASLRRLFRHSAIAMSSWTGQSGLTSTFSGGKYPGALGYPSGWNLDHEKLRRRSRIAYWESVHGRALIGRLVDNTVNTGLKLESAPIWEICWLKASEEEKRVWIRNTESRYHLWANSKEPSASGRMTLYQLETFEFLNRLRDGETFLRLHYSSDNSRMNPLYVQFFQPDQIYTPGSSEMLKAAKLRGNKIVDGIEISKTGEEIAYYVHDEETGKPTRVIRKGPKSGKLFMIHSPLIDSVGQVRGIPILANMIHELQKLTDADVAEIESMIINACIAAYIEPSEGKASSRPFDGIRLRNTGAELFESTQINPPTTGVIHKPGLIIQNLGPGEKISEIDTKRPSANRDTFVKSIKSGLSASIGIPDECVEMSFNQNYSASRATLILFWNDIAIYRVNIGADILNPLLEAWMGGEIESNRIKALGWKTAVTRRAWLNCSWTGISKPSIDPLKEVKAVQLRTGLGHTTGEREARIYNGSEFSENIERLKVENPELTEAKKSLAPAILPSGENGDGDKEEAKEEVAEMVIEELR